MRREQLRITSCRKVACLVPGLILTVVCEASGAEQGTTVWERLAPYLAPPARLANDFGTYPSVLKFCDGRPARRCAS